MFVKCCSNRIIWMRKKFILKLFSFRTNASPVEWSGSFVIPPYSVMNLFTWKIFEMHYRKLPRDDDTLCDVIHSHPNFPSIDRLEETDCRRTSTAPQQQAAESASASTDINHQPVISFSGLMTCECEATSTNGERIKNGNYIKIIISSIDSPSTTPQS